MKIIHCTQKLLKKLPKPPIEVDELTRQKSSAGLGSWYANTFLVNRKTQILFTGENTLYSFIVPNARKKVFESLHSAFLWYLELNLKYEKIPEAVISKILKEHENIVYTKTINKSTLGFMRDITYYYQHYLYEYLVVNDAVILPMTNKINEIPHKMVDYVFPIDLLKKVVKEAY